MLLLLFCTRCLFSSSSHRKWNLSETLAPPAAVWLKCAELLQFVCQCERWQEESQQDKHTQRGWLVSFMENWWYLCSSMSVRNIKAESLKSLKWIHGRWNVLLLVLLPAVSVNSFSHFSLWWTTPPGSNTQPMNWSLCQLSFITAADVCVCLSVCVVFVSAVRRLCECESV